MIALAADSWRQELQEAKVESEYLDRLSRDISAGLLVLADERARYGDVRRAALAVIDVLDGEASTSDNNTLVDNFLVAAQTGFDEEEMASDVTYNELVVSGRLNLINDHSLRESVVAYYRGAQRLSSSLNGLPGINYAVGSLTGYLPIEYLTFGEQVSANDRKRLLEALQSDSELVRDIRQLHSELTFLDRQFESLISQGRQLVTLLQ